MHQGLNACLYEEAPGRRPVSYEEELDVLEWQRQASAIEQGSYLLAHNGSAQIEPVGRHVVFVKEGYFDQRKKLGLSLSDPLWTSNLLRRWQSTSFCLDKLGHQLGGIGHVPLGIVEHCKVLRTTFHKGTFPHSWRADSPAHQDSELSDESEQLMEETHQTDCDNHLGNSHNQSRATGWQHHQDGGSLQKVHFFVRVHLQQLGRKGSRLTACMTVVDHYIDLGVGEWIVPRERYLHRMEHRWTPGERIEMWWLDGCGGMGKFWQGDVLGYVQRRPDDPFYSSPWASVIVHWLGTDADDAIGHMSPWELLRPDTEPRSDSEYNASERDESDYDWGYVMSPRSKRRR